MVSERELRSGEEGFRVFGAKTSSVGEDKGLDTWYKIIGGEIFNCRVKLVGTDFLALQTHVLRNKRVFPGKWC